MKRLLFFLFLSSLFPFSLCARPRIESFPLRSVRLVSGPFFEARQRDRSYLLAMDPDRLLAPYLREAGLEPKAASYPNWENTGLDGHIGGHYLSALSMLYASQPDAEVGRRLGYFLSELARCQQALGTGYIGGVPQGVKLWEEIRAGKIEAEPFALNGRWVPLYNIHKILAGLRDAWLIAGDTTARTMLVRYGDWAWETFGALSEEQMQEMLRSEHGGLNEVFADLAQITGEERFAELARQFSHRSLLDAMAEGRDILTGMHANTQIPKVIGFQRIAELTGDERWSRAAVYFWDNVAGRRTVVVGGNSVREHFHPADDFSTMISEIQGPETCNTYNMIRLSRMLYLQSGDTKYLDYMERALYNHILSTQHPEHGGLVYFTPMRPGHYRVYSQPHEGFWCCVGSGLESQAKYGEFVYAHRGAEELLVNLFVSSRLEWDEAGVRVAMQTAFPESDRVVLRVEADRPTRFTLSFRRPEWLAGEPTVTVNGRPVEKPGNATTGYLSIDRKWRDGDRVELRLPMSVRLEQLPDGEPYYAALYGPVVLAAAVGREDMPGLLADDSRGGHVATGERYPVETMPMWVGSREEIAAGIEAVEEAPLTFGAERVFYPQRYASLRLVPFYKLHDARYAIYFRRAASVSEADSVISLAAADDRRQVLERRTVDTVYAGEQQPESDHFVRSERSRIGVYENRRYREAEGWFAYEMKPRGRKAAVLAVTYHGAGSSGGYLLSVNGAECARPRVGMNLDERFYTVEYPLPESVRGDEILHVRFEAQSGLSVPRIFEVRLLE